MKLFATPNSPFSRIARIAIIELNLAEQVEVEFVTVRDANSKLLNYGPVGKVPALYLKGQLFCDTRIVLEQLEKVAAITTNPPKQISASIENSQALAFEGLCLSFLESIAVWIRENRRPKDLISDNLLAVERARANRCVKYLDENLKLLAEEISLASIATACALDLAQSRLGFAEHKNYPQLDSWLQTILARHSFKNTSPISS